MKTFTNPRMYILHVRHPLQRIHYSTMLQEYERRNLLHTAISMCVCILVHITSIPYNIWMIGNKPLFVDLLTWSTPGRTEKYTDIRRSRLHTVNIRLELLLCPKTQHLGWEFHYRSFLVSLPWFSTILYTSCRQHTMQDQTSTQ